MRLGIDIGGTNIKFLVLDDDTVSCKWQIPTNTESIEDFVNSIISQYRKVCSEYPIDSVGIGFPGSIRSGIVFAENLFREEFPFLKMLAAGIDVQELAAELLLTIKFFQAGDMQAKLDTW